MAADSKGRVFIFHRGNPAILVFDQDGNLLDSWGDGVFRLAHNVRVGRDGMIYCVDFGDHTVRKFTPEGELLLTLGIKDKPSDTGAVGFDYRTIRRVAGPFNAPTDISFGRNGDMYVSDGYGNARIHKFSKDGDLLASWGEPGNGQSQFQVLHAIWVDSHDRLLVADRENSRVQVLTAEGEFNSQWTDSNRPASIIEDTTGNFVVAEMGYLPESMFPNSAIPDGRDIFPRITIRSPQGRILSKWGGMTLETPGNFSIPHSLCTDTSDNLYVADVADSKYITTGQVQKFVRKR